MPLIGATTPATAASPSASPTPTACSVEQALALPVRPATLPVTDAHGRRPRPERLSLRVDRELLAASLLDGASVSVGVSPSAAFDVPSLLMTLDRYPYGCAEQTTSRALPLLYVSELVGRRRHAGRSGAASERIQDAIYRVLNYQSSSGSFGLWGPGSGDLWLDSYVTDFLTRAREQNYDVPAQAMLQALNNLQNSLSYDIDLEDRGTEIAYALYVLARNKQGLGRRPALLCRHEARGLLQPDGGGAARREPRALRRRAALGSDLHRRRSSLRKTTPDYDCYRSDYGSQLRDGAAMLALAAESKPMPSVVPELITLRRGRARRDALDQHAGRRLDAACGARAAGRQRRASSSPSTAQPHTGAYLRARRPARTCWPTADRHRQRRHRSASRRW